MKLNSNKLCGCETQIKRKFSILGRDVKKIV